MASWFSMTRVDRTAEKSYPVPRTDQILGGTALNTPSRVALQLLLAAGAVVATGTVASAEPPPCKGWATAAEHADAAPVEAFNISCLTDDPSFKQGWPVKW